MFYGACLASMIAAAALKYEPSGYVQDGLVAHFDGIRNAGRNVPHAPAATAWANLAGTGNNAPLTVNDAESKWLENGYFFGGGTYGQLAVQQYLGSNYTVQIACDVDTREQFAIRAANGKALRWPHLFGAGSSDCCNFYYHLEWNAEGNLNSPLCFKDTAGTSPAKVRLTWLWQRDGTCLIIR